MSIFGNTLLSMGSLLFAFCLLICYQYKTKKTGFKNPIFMALIFVLMIVMFGELLAHYAIHHYNTVDHWLVNLASRINNISTLVWILLICWYLVTLGNAYKSHSLLYYFKNYRYIRVFTYFFSFLIIVTLFFPFSNVLTEDGAYLYGIPQVILYIGGATSIFLAIVIVVRDKSKLFRFNGFVLMLGASFSTGAMVFQVINPYILVITTAFVFDIYLLYFMFENPDLYMIRELEKTRRKAESSNNVKTDFLASMSHEIRTPINAILGFSEGVINLNNYDWNQTRSDISHIDSAAKNLLEIINNILDISRIEAGEDKLEINEYSTEKLLLELKDVALSKMLNDEVEFILDVDPNLPSMLKGDYEKVSRILLNIINNAIKYTEVGKIIVSLRYQLANGGVLLHFKISDTGSGFNEDEKGRLFSKLDNSGHGNEYGLGLIIARNLVLYMNGSIDYETSFGAGTTFTIDLPQEIGDSTPVGDLSNKSLNKEKKYLNCTGLNILVVDDNMLNLKVAEKLLAPYRFNITSLTSGKECIDYIKKDYKYDLILLDYMMPDMDGIEVLHILKKLEGFKIPPIVVLTANAVSGMKEVYFNEGFDDYVPKPIDTSDLDRVINKFLKDVVKSNVTDADAVRLTADVTDNNKMNSVKILEDYGVNYMSSLSYISDIDSYNEILRDFYYSLDKTINDLNSSRISKDLLLYSTVAHSLKSNCQSLGFTAFSKLAADHETAGNNKDVGFIDSNFSVLVKESKRAKRIIEKYLNIK